jgi:hypothetical protein
MNDPMFQMLSFIHFLRLVETVADGWVRRNFAARSMVNGEELIDEAQRLGYLKERMAYWDAHPWWVCLTPLGLQALKDEAHRRGETKLIERLES